MEEGKVIDDEFIHVNFIDECWAKDEDLLFCGLLLIRYQVESNGDMAVTTQDGEYESTSTVRKYKVNDFLDELEVVPRQE